MSRKQKTIAMDIFMAIPLIFVLGFGGWLIFLHWGISKGIIMAFLQGIGVVAASFWFVAALIYWSEK